MSHSICVCPRGLTRNSWDAKEFKYKVTDSVERTNDVAKLDEYVFIVRKRISALYRGGMSK